MKRQLLRRLSALALSLATLGASLFCADASAPGGTPASTLADSLLRWELGDFFGTDLLSDANVLALRQSPLLLQQRGAIVSLMSSHQENTPDASGDASDVPPITPVIQPSTEISFDGLTFADNGVPSQTVVTTTEKGYTVVNGVYIKNTSSRQMDAAELATDRFSARLSADGPQVLIIHSHATEAYTMPAGQEYEASGTFRTRDTTCNVVRVGDEVAAVLSGYGISVLHDRTLHDAQSYNDAYGNSLASIERYLEKYPTLSFVLDIHRDAIQDADGNQYKLITREDARVAQCSLVMGVAHDGWRDNLALATAVQQRLNALSPTLMRPVAARGYRYNQHLRAGSLLVEIGAAGNSLDEALMGARYFAAGFAETILAAE